MTNSTNYRDVTISGEPGDYNFNIGRQCYYPDTLDGAHKMIDTALAETFVHRGVTVAPGDDGIAAEFEIAGHAYQISGPTPEARKIAATAAIDALLRN